MWRVKAGARTRLTTDRLGALGSGLAHHGSAGSSQLIIADGKASSAGAAAPAVKPQWSQNCGTAGAKQCPYLSVENFVFTLPDGYLMKQNAGNFL